MSSLVQQEEPESELLASVFEEHAEYLSREELLTWTVQTPNDKLVLAKLKGPGAKLLTGPRGSGKSSYLRRAYYELQDERQVLVAYINFSRSLALEPMFHRNANALALFRQWVLGKIVLGVSEGLTAEEMPPIWGDSRLLTSVSSDLLRPGKSRSSASFPLPLPNSYVCWRLGHAELGDVAASFCSTTPPTLSLPNNSESSLRYSVKSGPARWHPKRPFIRELRAIARTSTSHMKRS